MWPVDFAFHNEIRAKETPSVLWIAKRKDASPDIIMKTTSCSEELDPSLFRPDFPILRKVLRDGIPLVYLDNAATTQRPRQVIAAIVDIYEHHYSNVHRGIHTLADETTELYEGARDRLKEFLNAADRGEIVFTSGATAGINLVAHAWGDANVREGDEILLTEMEHHSNMVPWYQLAQRTGAVVRHLPLTEEGTLELRMLPQFLTEKTKLLAVTAVSNVLGTINPLHELIPAAHAVGAKVLVDGAQSVPHHPTDVQGLDADFLVFSGHKMLGPTGVGVLYAKRELLESMPPFLGGGSMIHEVTLEGFVPGDIPARFEAGTPPIVGAIGLRAAVDYLEKVGLSRIEAHERRLTERLHAALGEVEGARILGPDPAHKAGIVSFVLKDLHAQDLAHLLDRFGIAVRAGHHCAMPLHRRYGVAASARASFYLYNTSEDVDHLIEGMLKSLRLSHRRKA
ncbi:SufS family cysteine desulfurase [Thermopirellula anaerolimosa]